MTSLLWLAAILGLIGLALVAYVVATLIERKR